jgi:high-affinity nickel-transport protein
MSGARAGQGYVYVNPLMLWDFMSSATSDSTAQTVPLRSRITVMFVALALVNVAAWVWAFAQLNSQPVLLGTAFLAYVLGLRHAVDTDHIAAIDNVTRKLLQDGAQPVTTGLWFALGHSTVVFAACLIIGILAAGATGVLSGVKSYGHVVGTMVSTFFLLAIGLLNLTIFLGVWKTLQRVRRGNPCRDDDLDLLMAKHGLLARLLRPLFRLITRPWHMYPLGLLFGLGFDTATSIGLFSMAAVTASDGISLATVMVFPVLFAAGMALADAADGAIMLGAYQWARKQPARKLYYNLSITGASVFIALAIGSLQGMSLLAELFSLSGGIWSLVAELTERFDILGFVIVLSFVLLWAISALILRFSKPAVLSQS